MSERLTVIRLAEHDAAANLAAEEALFNELRSSPRTVCLFYVNAPCVVLGRNNPEALWVDQRACAADNVPVLRRFSGGGTVYHDLDNLNFSFLVPKKLLEACFAPGAVSGPRQYIDFFRSVIVAALSRGGAGYSATGVSDVSLNGRKVSGNAQRISSSLVLHHGTLMRRCPLAAFKRYLPIPPDRPGIPHERFVTGLEEEGRLHSEGELMNWLASELAGRLGLSV